MNRRERLKFISVPAGMAVAAAVQKRRRGGLDHEFIVGGFVLFDGGVILRAVRMGPAYEIDGSLTTEARRFARWRTKQAAWQWLQLRPDLARRLRVIHLGRLDVLNPEASLTAGQP